MCGWLLLFFVIIVAVVIVVVIMSSYRRFLLRWLVSSNLLYSFLPCFNRQIDRQMRWIQIGRQKRQIVCVKISICLSTPLLDPFFDWNHTLATIFFIAVSAFSTIFVFTAVFTAIFATISALPALPVLLAFALSSTRSIAEREASYRG